MNPKTQDCLGYYLYGAGHQAREDNTLGLVTGQGTARPHFCLSCPKRRECEDEHEKRVRRLAPKAAEGFDRLMKAALRRGLPPTLAAVLIGQRGLDPFATEAVQNFKRGHADRGRESGILAK